MFPKTANFFVYLIGPWLLSGRLLHSLMLASAVGILAASEYGWGTIQLFGVGLVIVVFLRMSGLLPFWPV